MDKELLFEDIQFPIWSDFKLGGIFLWDNENTMVAEFGDKALHKKIVGEYREEGEVDVKYRLEKGDYYEIETGKYVGMVRGWGSISKRDKPEERQDNIAEYILRCLNTAPSITDMIEPYDRPLPESSFPELEEKNKKAHDNVAVIGHVDHGKASLAAALAAAMGHHVPEVTLADIDRESKKNEHFIDASDISPELFTPIKRIEPIVKDKKIHRNTQCPCGSGVKYKKCCIKM